MATDTSPAIVVAALYHFARLYRFESLKRPLATICCGLGIKGTLLLASEGINGTVAGSRAAIDTLIAWLRDQPEFSGLEHKESFAETMPFHRMKVRLKREIVTMGVPDTDPLTIVGTYVDAHDWNALIADPETVVIDTRNAYEVAVGTFRGAIDPETETFREFPDWVARNENRLRGKKKIAMFCTGGIRCEKATAFMKTHGYDDVYHLKGGILKYLEEVPQEQSLWDGECFVFDERVSVGHGLVPGANTLCRACGNPLTIADRRSPHYRRGISCHQCIGTFSDADRARFAERQRQVDEAETRGERHVGDR